MFKGFLTGFIVVVLAIAVILYAYGRKTLSNMSTAKTEAYVESTETPSFGNWSEYTPPTKKFTAKFPSSPQHATDKATDAKTKELKQYEMYISESEGKVFMISVISFLNADKAKKDEKAVLKSIVDDMVSSNSSNKLEKLQYGTFEGLNDVDFVIVNKSYAVVGRAFVDENQLYVLSALTKTPEESKREFNYFINSFKLTGHEPANTTLMPLVPIK